jgi:hypothetical protein
MNLICASRIEQTDLQKHIINDQLVLQLVGTLTLFLSKCNSVSQSLLYHEQLYPIGYRRKKMTLQKLLEDK